MERLYQRTELLLLPSFSFFPFSNFHHHKMISNEVLHLSTSNFTPLREGHPPTGTFPEEVQGSIPKLFTSIESPYARDALTTKNRIVVSPMCQYSVKDGFPTPYHLAHLGQFALHGAGSIMVEASGVQPQGRITPQCLGIWKDEHTAAHASLVQAIKSFAPEVNLGIQLAHAGRKASDHSPFYRGEKKAAWVTAEEGGWPEEVIGPSPIPYSDSRIVPKEMTLEQIKKLEDDFVEAARRAFEAGYDFVECHFSHGYAGHSFLSPLSNKRTDHYGGSFENRTRLALDIVKRIRADHPTKGLWFRVSATDFCEHLEEKSWDISETLKLAKLLDQEKVDVLDVSGGGNSPQQQIKPQAGYQLGFAAEIKKLQGLKMLVGAVGMMEGDSQHPGQFAEEALQEGKADLIFLARSLMTHPTFAEDAAVELMGVRTAENPQYHRAHPAKRSSKKLEHTS